MKKQSAVPLVLVTLFVVSVAWGFDDPPKTPAGIVIESRDGKPLITEKDILKYDWTTHTITLAPGLRATLQEQLRASLVGGYRIRMIVDERVLYQGVITTGISSVSFKVPVIVIDKCIQDEKLGEDQIQIELGYPTHRFFQGDDPRSNSLLKKSLQKAEKLRPVAPEAKWSETVGGLQYRLFVAPHDPAKTKAVDALTFEVRNVTDKPIDIEAYGGKAPWLDVRITGYRELMTPPVFAKVGREPLALQAGKTWRCKVSDSYHIAHERFGGGDHDEGGRVKFNPAGKTYELSITGSSTLTAGVPLTARLTLPTRPKPAVYWPPTDTPAPLSTAWSQPTDHGLQTRIAAHAESFVLGKSIPMRVELRHKDRKDWGLATCAFGYQGTITVSDAAGKEMGRRRAFLDFQTILRKKDFRVLAVFDLSHAEYGVGKPGKYSVRFGGVPKKPNLVALPASEVFEFEVRGR